jgi:hypothetical protein
VGKNKQREVRNEKSKNYNFTLPTFDTLKHVMRIFFYLAHTFRFAEKKKKVFSKKKEVK